MTVTVYLLNGSVREHPNCQGRVYEGVLTVTTKYNGYVGGDDVASYPLTSIERWEP